MLFYIEMPRDIVSVLFSVFAWIIYITIVVRLYLKQQEKPAIWKLILVSIIAMASLSIYLNEERTLKFPLLPLGFWAVYLWLRKKTWKKYRAYAWSGFLSELLFLIAAVVAIPVYNWIYPHGVIKTYIADTVNAAVVPVHPSASLARLDQELFNQSMMDFQLSEVDGDQWYRNSIMESESYYQRERFPYQLVGTSPRWGSGIPTVIYIEDDGKGILITIPDQQYYYRFEERVIEIEGLEGQNRIE